MITESFDSRGTELIRAKDTIREEMRTAAAAFHIRTAVVVFSYRLIDLLKEEEIIEILDERIRIGSSAGVSPVYRIKDTDTALLLSGVGAPLACAAVEELKALFDIKDIVVFGSCGVLQKIPEGKVIVPTEAYRDEGCSYHYVEAGDFIRIRNADVLCRMFDQAGVDHIKGKTWTTDAFYRETDNNRDRRLEQGCICVDMECSALQAVCDMRGIGLYQFLYSADSLNGSWSRRILGNMDKDVRLTYFRIAAGIAASLDRKTTQEEHHEQFQQ